MRRPELIARQAGRPSGLLGRFLTRVMALETAAANRAAIARLAPAPDARLLEVGCGHGRTVAALANAVPRGHVTGVDHSPAALAVARHRCAALLRVGRVRFDCADSAALPYGAATFDGALAVHTVYFWSPLETHLAELRRVLAPGARLVLGFRRPSARTRADLPASVYTLREPAAIAASLRAAGFAAVDLEIVGDELVLAVATGAV